MSSDALDADDWPLTDRLALLWSEFLTGEVLRVTSEGIPTLSNDGATRTIHEAHKIVTSLAGPTMTPETPEQREQRYSAYRQWHDAHVAKLDRDVTFGRTLARELIAAGRAEYVWRDAVEGERDVYRSGVAEREHVTLLRESRVHVRRDGVLICKATMRADTLQRSAAFPSGRDICRSCAQRLAKIGRD